MLIQPYLIFQLLAFTLNSIASSNVTKVEENLPVIHQNLNNEQITNNKTGDAIFSDSILVKPTNNTHSLKTNSTQTESEKGEKTHSRGVTDTGKIPDGRPIPGGNGTDKSHPKSDTKSTTSKVLPLNPISVPSNATSATSTTVTTTTTTSTTTTTTAAPKKPTLTVSVEDDPILRQKIDKTNIDLWKSNAHDVSPDGPITLQSSEEIYGNHDGRQYIVSIVGIIFAIPLLILLGNSFRRRLRDYWSKRKYRRMDYLIEEMYN